MYKKRRRIVLTKHFVNRWHKWIGYDKKRHIKRRLHELMSGRAIHCIGGTFVLHLGHSKLLAALKADGTWVFVTVLGPGMEVKPGQPGQELEGRRAK